MATKTTGPVTITDSEVDIITNDAQLSRRCVCLLVRLPVWLVSKDSNFELQHCILGETPLSERTKLYMQQVLLSAVNYDH